MTTTTTWEISTAACLRCDQLGPTWLAATTPLRKILDDVETHIRTHHPDHPAGEGPLALDLSIVDMIRAGPDDREGILATIGRVNAERAAGWL